MPETYLKQRPFPPVAVASLSLLQIPLLFQVLPMSPNLLSADFDVELLRLGGLIHVGARARGRSGVKNWSKCPQWDFPAPATSADLPDSTNNFNNELAVPCEDQ